MSAVATDPQEAESHSSDADVREDGSYVDSALGRRSRVTPTVTIVEPSAFDWGDAGVGAAGAFGLTLLAGGVAVMSLDSCRRAA